MDRDDVKGCGAIVGAGAGTFVLGCLAVAVLVAIVVGTVAHHLVSAIGSPTQVGELLQLRGRIGLRR